MNRIIATTLANCVIAAAGGAVGFIAGTILEKKKSDKKEGIAGTLKVYLPDDKEDKPLYFIDKDIDVDKIMKDGFVTLRVTTITIK